MDWKLLEIYCGGHYGFGSYEAPVWLVGPGANHLGGTAEEVEQRLAGWHRRGQREMDDLYALHAASGDVGWFTPNPRVERSWSRLSRLALSLKGERITDDSVKSYQAEQLGRHANKDVGLISLLTANAVSKPWPFTSSPVGYLANPDRYLDRFMVRRARHIRSRLRRHQPGLVVFYDKTHADIWTNIAGVTFAPTELPSCRAARTEGTLFMLVRHPESIGTTNRYFEQAGELAATILEAKTHPAKTTRSL